LILKKKKNQFGANYRFVLALQEDGNLVLYYMDPKWVQGTPEDKRIVVWATYKFVEGNKNSQLIMQDDGNLVVYSEFADAIWASDQSTVVSKAIKKNDFITKNTSKTTQSVFDLANSKLKVECQSGAALSKLYLSLTNNILNYAYSCTFSPRITQTCQVKTTPLNSIGATETRSSNFLDRHDITCFDPNSKNSNIIQSIELKRKNKQIYYEYKCCAAENQGGCLERKTPENKYALYEIKDLANKSNVETSKSTGFSRIKLDSNGPTNFYYTWFECALDY